MYISNAPQMNQNANNVLFCEGPMQLYDWRGLDFDFCGGHCTVPHLD